MRYVIGRREKTSIYTCDATDTRHATAFVALEIQFNLLMCSAARIDVATGLQVAGNKSKYRSILNML